LNPLKNINGRKGRSQFIVQEARRASPITSPGASPGHQQDHQQLGHPVSQVVAVIGIPMDGGQRTRLIRPGNGNRRRLFSGQQPATLGRGRGIDPDDKGLDGGGRHCNKTGGHDKNSQNFLLNPVSLPQILWYG